MLTREQAICSLKNGICPICEKEGFKMPMGHIRQRHGIFAKELKDELLLSRNKGFCDDNLSKLRREQALKMCGEGILIRPDRTGQKIDSFSMIKFKNKRPDLIEKFVSVTTQPEIIRKRVKSRDYKKNGIQTYKGIMDVEKISRTMLGCDPDLHYSILVKELTAGSMEYTEISYRKTASRLSMNYETLRSGIKRQAIKRGLIELNSIPNSKTFAKMTEKSRLILREAGDTG